MNDTTRELLLKTRKGSTAGFGVKQWGEVLTELGFVFKTIKEGRSIVGVEIMWPYGAYELKINKESHYKHIVFYELGRWLKSHNLDLVEMSSKLLGLDTPEVEKAKKNLYARDLTNTGTCPICMGNFKMDGAGIGHHGFRRPGDGMLHGSCFGVGHAPWEISALGAYLYTVELASIAVKIRKTLEYRLSGEVTELGYLDWENKLKVVRLVEDPLLFNKVLEDLIERDRREIKSIERQIETYENNIKEWEADILPEFKYAGLFKKT